ncbi:MAG: 4Fe-4S dicluster domain-containing protein [Armatimonadetes bacterium]|nr:4Fe-4S dicluster domain-containing protein [Armatimonadota bacterium]
MARLAMLIDLTRCIGCDACTVACKQENGTPMDVFFARVLNIEAGKYPDAKRVYLPMLCYHCENPACLKACPNKAIFMRPDGVVLIDQDRCRGTGACVSACPYGNIVLKAEDAWYLNEDEAYERDFVKPRLNQNVARKCTYCVQRVDVGLDPACVVACPTKARIFGDMDNPESEISTYIEEQVVETKRSPFQLLPEAGTNPAGRYLGTMAKQASSTFGQRAGVERAEPLDSPAGKPTTPKAKSGSMGVHWLATLLALLMLFGMAALGRGQGTSESPVPENLKTRPTTDHFATSNCMGCHGMSAMGGLGPPIAQTKVTLEKFEEVVRKGKGMMPATKEADLSAQQLREIFEEVKAKPWDETQIPIAYKVGSLLSTRNVGIIFSLVTLFALIFGVKIWIYWIRLSAPKQLWPAMKKFGLGKSFGVLLQSLIVDGFCVASLYRKDKFRWFMHGLILYGFCALMLGDVLMQIFNPLRSELPFTDPLKLLPVLGGAAAMTGVMYVMVRYRKDQYIDNGMTQGRDFLFVTLLFHALVAGFLTLVMKRAGLTGWVMPIYLYHLAIVLVLLATAPFTRFAHVWIVPTMVALTKLADAIVESGVEIGFRREPSPGRHHKSQRIAEQLMRELEPGFDGPVKLRYYP